MLVPMKESLQPTRQHGFAIGTSNVADNCLLHVVMDGAEATNIPAITAIHPSERDFVGDAFFIHACEITQRSPVPLVLHLDHGASVEHALHAIHYEFTSIMVDGSLLPYEENMALIIEVVRPVHVIDVSVEGELETIGRTGTSIEGDVSQVAYTDPVQTADFIARTDADILTMAIDTAYNIYPKGMQSKLQMGILRNTVGHADIPLVLRGGSANPDAEAAELVTPGIGEINISSNMKYAYFQRVRETLAKESWRDPNVIYPDAINVTREVIHHKMRLFGSLGKASLY